LSLAGAGPAQERPRWAKQPVLRHDAPVPTRRALAILAASAVCFALMAFAAKLASARLSGAEIAFLRFVVMLVPLVAVPRLGRRALEFERVDLLIYRGVFGGLAVLLYFLAIAHIPVGLATLLTYTAPVWSVTFAALFLGEAVDRRLVLPLVAALTGMVIAAGGGRHPGALFSFGRWEALGAVSSVFSGAAYAAIRAARRTEGSWSVYGSFSLCGLLATAPFALVGFQLPTAREWLLLLAVGGCAVAAQLLMTYAYRWVTNLEAGVLSQLTVVLSLLFGMVFLGDRPTPLQAGGSLLTLTGVIGVIWMQGVAGAGE
jgi:drug/metabolite transporter (DMT)-like permease